jgi:hypothetical protein
MDQCLETLEFLISDDPLALSHEAVAQLQREKAYWLSLPQETGAHHSSWGSRNTDKTSFRGIPDVHTYEKEATTASQK